MKNVPHFTLTVDDVALCFAWSLICCGDADYPAAAASAATVVSDISAGTPRIATYSLAHFVFLKDSSHTQLSKYLIGKSCVYRVHAESPCNCILDNFASL